LEPKFNSFSAATEAISLPSLLQNTPATRQLVKAKNFTLFPQIKGFLVRVACLLFSPR